MDVRESYVHKFFNHLNRKLMKKHVKLSALMLVFIMLITSKLNAQTITIDGNFSDWATIPYLHTNTVGTGGEITAIKAVAGAEYIYFYLEGTESFVFSAYDLYIDTDGSIATGFLSGGYPSGSGAELLLQGEVASTGSVNSYIGSGTDWAWAWLGGYGSSEINFSSLITLTGKKAIEFSIKKSFLGTIGSNIGFAIINRVEWTATGSIPAVDLGGSYLQVSTADVLPVQLINFTAKIDGNATRLNWQTASEQNNKSFIISRSGDNQIFSEIGELQGKGTTQTTSNYTFYDTRPLNGNNYYKLTQIDLDGKPTKIGEQVLNFSFSAAKINISPNPTQGKIDIRFAEGKYTSLVLTSIEGRVIQKIDLKSNESQLALNLTSYPAGIYFVKLVGNNNSIVQKTIKH